MSTDGWASLGVVPRMATSSAIAARILELAERGDVGPGTALPPERDLATQLGVSRTTIREAIHELTLKGVVRRRQGSGTVLLDTSSAAASLLRDMSASERDATEVIDFRTTFEPQIAGLAAGRRTDSDLLVLANHCDFDPATVSTEESLEHDQRFHEAIAAATHNHLIVSLSRATSEWVSDFRRISHASPTGRATSLTGHRAILAAIENGDSDEAARHMREHVTIVGRI
ncbi:FadR/GntR family transcriptional regulator [Microbacterium sp. NPDC055910]|uniref:FadR/GntR family transcriptional regulator n=1 Tax=Microbacterium sp. NPDC055910 TaxID=3345659 RepID=UPI0035DC6B4A